ncbi:MAG: hypothetical protein LH702_15415 [Phormidesmis sp. CAN_BIN44]|nr:hypothetical protein [Phormidesmis sp. CAN_BIN44]
MDDPDEILKLQLYPRVTEAVSIQVPIDTLESLKKVADSREMSVEALMKLYIGRGLRQDLTQI